MRWAKYSLITTLLLVMLSGCASHKSLQPGSGEQLYRQLSEILIQATYSLDTTTLTATSVEELLPLEALSLTQIPLIPLFDEQLSRFKDEVNKTFVTTAWQAAPLLEVVIHSLPWSEEENLLASLRSGSEVLKRSGEEAVRDVITPILHQNLDPAITRWRSFISWYHLYQESTKLLEIQTLPILDEMIEEHLSTLYLQRYFGALGDEEYRLRNRLDEAR